MTTKQKSVLYAITYYYRNKSSDTQSLCHPKAGLGVTVMEILGGSRDLIHYPLQDAISLAD